MKNAYLVHGWDGYPDNCWFPWLKEELEKRGYTVSVPAMPDPETPTIGAWVGVLKELIKPSDETILIGHSIGCQAVLRYLESAEQRVRAVFLVAGFVNLKGLETEEEKEIAKPWIETPIAWDVVRSKADAFVALFSDNDEFVDVGNGGVFKEKLSAKVIVEHDKGHFEDEAGIKEIPSLLKEIDSVE